MLHFFKSWNCVVDKSTNTNEDDEVDEFIILDKPNYVIDDYVNVSHPCESYDTLSYSSSYPKMDEYTLYNVYILRHSYKKLRRNIQKTTYMSLTLNKLVLRKYVTKWTLYIKINRYIIKVFYDKLKKYACKRAFESFLTYIRYI